MAEKNDSTGYTPDRRDVFQSEKEYVRKRREVNKLPLGPENNSERENLWGLCLSGGGIRSATFGLGVLQSLTRAHVLKRIDYLSTVSGGGYIGSCLTSLLSNGEEGKVIRRPLPDGGGKDVVPGVDMSNSPFTGMYKEPDDDPESEIRLRVRHQIHHLRTHGEYLTPNRRGLLTRDVQRAVGATLTGITHHFVLFFLTLIVLVGLTHLFVAPFDVKKVLLRPPSGVQQPARLLATEGTAPELMARPIPPEDESIGQILKRWWLVDVWGRFKILCNPGDGPLMDQKESGWVQAILAFVVLGAGWYWIWIRVCKYPKLWAACRSRCRFHVKSGFTLEDDKEWRFTAFFNGVTIAVAVSVAWITALLTEGRLPMAVFWPLAFAVGGRLVTLLANVESEQFSEIGQRSLTNILSGGAVYGVVMGLLAPLAVVLVFSLSALAWGKILVALPALILGHRAQLFANAGKDQPSSLRKWIGKIVPPLAVILGVGLAFSFVSELLVDLYPLEEKQFVDIVWPAAAYTVLAAVAAVVAIGFAVNSNQISPHYFYRDRLVEAYLKTDARVAREAGDDEQGRPLKTLRNDESLPLRSLGKDNGRGPYHLIVTALNLSGSLELNRKTMLSDHFVFSKNYCGSEVTGYVKTDQYRDGKTKLARAMTISAAAAGSASGFHTTGWSAFLFTLFNVRLGYWMENPWHYRLPETRPSLDYHTFWPLYLGIEMLNATTARHRLVNLSDGGHTGDNLGLLPLLQRRCKVIVVSDAEADPNHIFESFNNAARMAWIEENIRIDIPDLEKILPRQQHNDGGELRVKRGQVCWAEGTIHYPEVPPDTKGGRGLEAMTGRLIYLKSSLSADLPEHVRNYARTHPDFPHQSTADQFFDDAQFESYRVLGEHIAKRALDDLTETAEVPPARSNPDYPLHLWHRMEGLPSDGQRTKKAVSNKK